MKSVETWKCYRHWAAVGVYRRRHGGLSSECSTLRRTSQDPSSMISHAANSLAIPSPTYSTATDSININASNKINQWLDTYLYNTQQYLWSQHTTTHIHSNFTVKQNNWHLILKATDLFSNMTARFCSCLRWGSRVLWHNSDAVRRNILVSLNKLIHWNAIH